MIIPAGGVARCRKAPLRGHFRNRVNPDLKTTVPIAGKPIPYGAATPPSDTTIPKQPARADIPFCMRRSGFRGLLAEARREQ
jgi:hypothetical protein